MTHKELMDELADAIWAGRGYRGRVLSLLCAGLSQRHVCWKRYPLRVLMKLRGMIHRPTGFLSNQTVVVLNRLSDYLGRPHQFKRLKLDERGWLVFDYPYDSFVRWCCDSIHDPPYEQVTVGRLTYHDTKGGYVQSMIAAYLRYKQRSESMDLFTDRFTKYGWVHQTLFHSAVLWSAALMALAEDTIEYREEATDERG